MANVFKQEQEATLAELRTFVSQSAHLDENKIMHLETKINSQVIATYFFSFEKKDFTENNK